MEPIEPREPMEPMEPSESEELTLELDGRSYTLNCEQSQLYELVMEKIRNLEHEQFFTAVMGAAGTGKSLLLKIIRQEAKQMLGENGCLTLAPTPNSANKVNSQTISDFIKGIRLDGNCFDKLSKDVKQKQYKTMKYKKLLLIDVINYCSSNELAEIDYLLQEVMKNQKPFGGLSVIIFGDLLQLQSKNGSPIYRDVPLNIKSKRDSVTPQSPKILWNLFEMLELLDNERVGSSNFEFAELLENIRSSDEVQSIHEKLIEKCASKTEIETFPPEDELIKLRKNNPGKTFAIIVIDGFPKKYNQSILERLGNSVEISPDHMSALESTHVLEKLVVALGSQVMITCDLPEHDLHAGTLGIINMIAASFISVEFPSGTVDLQKTNIPGTSSVQYPIRLAEVFTVAESQGMEFDGVVIIVRDEILDPASEKTNAPQPGQFYTALSRARSLELCKVTGLQFFEYKISKPAMEDLEKRRNGMESIESKHEIIHTYSSILQDI